MGELIPEPSGLFWDFFPYWQGVFLPMLPGSATNCQSGKLIIFLYPFISTGAVAMEPAYQG